MFWPKQRNALSRVVPPSTNTDYTRTSYKELKKVMIRSHDGRNVGIEMGDGNVGSFVGYAKQFFEKTGMTLRSIKLLAFCPYNSIERLYKKKEVAESQSINTGRLSTSIL